MSINLRVSLVIFSVVLSIITTTVLKRGRIPIKYSILWYLSSAIVFIVAIFPFVLEFFANIIGFTTISNLITAIMVGILLFLTLSLTIIIAGQNKKVTLLIQEVSMLKQELSNKK